jgi:hypothetical protein
MDHIVINVFWRYNSARNYGHTFLPLSRLSEETIFAGSGHVSLRLNNIIVKIIGSGDYWLSHG